MARFWGLRGSKLSLTIWAEACLGVMIFGYNQASAGGVLADVTFNQQFPQMNTLDTVGAQKQHNSRIQGELYFPHGRRQTLMSLYRNCRCALYVVWSVWSTWLYLSRGSPGSSEDHFHSQYCPRDWGNFTGICIWLCSIHCWTNNYRPGNWRDHCHCFGLAVRSLQSREPWRACFCLWRILRIWYCTGAVDCLWDVIHPTKLGLLAFHIGIHSVPFDPGLCLYF